MKYVLILLLCSGCAMQLRAEGAREVTGCSCPYQAKAQAKRENLTCCFIMFRDQIRKREGKPSILNMFRSEKVAKMHNEYQATKQTQTTSQVQEQSQYVTTSQAQTSVTKTTYGSMKKPMKTITIDVYQETDVAVEQKQQQIAALIAQLKQLQESKVTVDPKIKVIVR